MFVCVFVSIWWTSPFKCTFVRYLHHLDKVLGYWFFVLDIHPLKRYAYRVNVLPLHSMCVCVCLCFGFRSNEWNFRTWDVIMIIGVMNFWSDWKDNERRLIWENELNGSWQFFVRNYYFFKKNPAAVKEEKRIFPLILFMRKIIFSGCKFVLVVDKNVWSLCVLLLLWSLFFFANY